MLSLEANCIVSIGNLFITLHWVQLTFADAFWDFFFLFFSCSFLSDASKLVIILVFHRMDEGVPHEDSSSAVAVSSQHSSRSSGVAPVVMVPSSVVDVPPSQAENARVSTSMGVSDLQKGGAIPSQHSSSTGEYMAIVTVTSLVHPACYSDVTLACLYSTGFHQYPHKVDILYLQDQTLLQQPQAIVPQASSSGTAHSQPICSASQVGGNFQFTPKHISLKTNY